MPMTSRMSKEVMYLAALLNRFRKTGYGIYDCRVVDAVGDAEVAGAAEGAAGNNQDILF